MKPAAVIKIDFDTNKFNHNISTVKHQNKFINKRKESKIRIENIYQNQRIEEFHQNINIKLSNQSTRTAADAVSTTKVLQRSLE